MRLLSPDLPASRDDVTAHVTAAANHRVAVVTWDVTIVRGRLQEKTMVPPREESIADFILLFLTLYCHRKIHIMQIYLQRTCEQINIPHILLHSA